MKKITLVIFIFSIFVGCSMSSNNKKQDEFLMGSWSLKTIKNNPADDKNIKDAHLKLELKNSKFFGTDGCNNIFGNLKKVNEKELVFDHILSTRMACKDMEEAHLYKSLLKKVKLYILKKGYLALLDKERNILLEYEKQ